MALESLSLGRIGNYSYLIEIASSSFHLTITKMGGKSILNRCLYSFAKDTGSLDEIEAYEVVNIAGLAKEGRFCIKVSNHEKKIYVEAREAVEESHALFLLFRGFGHLNECQKELLLAQVGNPLEKKAIDSLERILGSWAKAKYSEYTVVGAKNGA